MVQALSEIDEHTLFLSCTCDGFQCSGIKAKALWTVPLHKLFLDKPACSTCVTEYGFMSLLLIFRFSFIFCSLGILGYFYFHFPCSCPHCSEPSRKKASKAVWEGREDSDLAEYVSPYFLFSLIFKKNIFCISRQLFSSYFFLQRNVVEGRKEKVSLSGKLMCSGLRFALKSSKYSRLILF